MSSQLLLECKNINHERLYHITLTSSCINAYQQELRETIVQFPKYLASIKVCLLAKTSFLNISLCSSRCPIKQGGQHKKRKSAQAMLNGLKIYLRKGIFSDSGAGTFPLQLHISHSWEHTVQWFGDLRKRKQTKNCQELQFPGTTRNERAINRRGQQKHTIYIIWQAVQRAFPIAALPKQHRGLQEERGLSCSAGNISLNKELTLQPGAPPD